MFITTDTITETVHARDPREAPLRVYTLFLLWRTLPEEVPRAASCPTENGRAAETPRNASARRAAAPEGGMELSTITNVSISVRNPTENVGWEIGEERDAALCRVRVTG